MNITELRALLGGIPQEYDGDYCPVCRMPLIRGDCVRHDTEEMIAWGNKYRRDIEAIEASLPALLDVAEAAGQVVAIDADPNGSVDANGVAIDALKAALTKLKDTP